MLFLPTFPVGTLNKAQQGIFGFFGYICGVVHFIEPSVEEASKMYVAREVFRDVVSLVAGPNFLFSPRNRP
jgi:hypothetical protein